MARDDEWQFSELKREFDRQEQAWAEVEANLRELSELPIAVSRRVVDDLDEAFAAARPSGPLHLFQQIFG